MSPTECATFTNVVYKDQTNPANQGKVVEIGDTVTLVLTNDNGVPSTQDITVTGVSDNGKTICWSTSGTAVRTTDIIRVHAKHTFECPGPHSCSIVVTKESSGLVEFVSLVINGATHGLGVEEPGEASSNWNPGIVTPLEEVLNELLLGNGRAHVSINSDELTISILGTSLNFGALVVNGADPDYDWVCE